MTEFFNRTTEKAMRRQLRKAMPKAEVLVWSRLRGKQLCGYKFRRQYSVGPYSIDFYCPAAKLAIEIDGDSHFYPVEQRYDSQRQRYIESFGIRCLRFTNSEIYENLEGVLETVARVLQNIAGWCRRRHPPQSPLRKGGSKKCTSRCKVSRSFCPGQRAVGTSPLTKSRPILLPLTKGELEGVL